MNNNDIQQFFNNITLSEFFMQYLTLILSMQDYTNTDIVNELQKQNKEYLETIIANQQKILNLLQDLQNNIANYAK